MAGLGILGRSVHGVQCSRRPTELRHDGAMTGVVGCHRLVVIGVVVRGSLAELAIAGHTHGAADLRLSGAVGAGAVAVLEVDVSRSRSSLSNLPCAHVLVFEHERGDDVGEPEGEGDDAGADDDL